MIKQVFQVSEQIIRDKTTYFKRNFQELKGFEIRTGCLSTYLRFHRLQYQSRRWINLDEVVKRLRDNANNFCVKSHIFRFDKRSVALNLI